MPLRLVNLHCVRIHSAYTYRRAHVYRYADESRRIRFLYTQSLHSTRQTIHHYFEKASPRALVLTVSLIDQQTTLRYVHRFLDVFTTNLYRSLLMRSLRFFVLLLSTIILSDDCGWLRYLGAGFPELNRYQYGKHYFLRRR